MLPWGHARGCVHCWATGYGGGGDFRGGRGGGGDRGGARGGRGGGDRGRGTW
jgi:hypothetical protein